MGVVYRSEDRLLGRTVAIKLLSLGRASDPSLVARFEREARAAASLCHPNVVSVFDAGSDEATRFIVMEYVRGMSLAELLSRQGRLQVEQAVDLAVQIASGLAAAHRSGIVHRDVKPGNVMIDESGTVKLLDFGIAHARTSTTLTQAGSVLGSARYIAPEVVLGGQAEERSDVYSLGCVLYEMVTGQPPFSGEVDAAVLHQHASARPRPPRALTAGIPRALDDLIMQMLSKRPTERPAAAPLVTALARTLPRAPQRRRPRPADRNAGAHATAPLPALERARPRRRRLALATLIIAVLAAMGLAIAAPNWRDGGGSSPAASAAAVHRTANGGHGGRRSPPLLPAAAGTIRDAARLVAAAVASAAVRAPAAVLAPPRKPAADRRVHPPRKKRTRSHGKKQVAPSPSQGREAEAPSSQDEAEAPSSSGQTEALPVETAPAEAQPPPATGGAPVH